MKQKKLILLLGLVTLMGTTPIYATETKPITENATTTQTEYDKQKDKV